MTKKHTKSLIIASIFCTLRLRLEDRLHLGNIQINLVFRSICTIFAPKLRKEYDSLYSRETECGPRYRKDSGG